MITYANFVFDKKPKNAPEFQRDLSEWIEFKDKHTDFDEPYTDENGFQSFPTKHITYRSNYGVFLTTTGFLIRTWYRASDNTYLYQIIGHFRVFRHRYLHKIDNKGELICESHNEYFSELREILASIVEGEV